MINKIQRYDFLKSSTTHSDKLFDIFDDIFKNDFMLDRSICVGVIGGRQRALVVFHGFVEILRKSYGGVFMIGAFADQLKIKIAKHVIRIIPVAINSGGVFVSDHQIRGLVFDKMIYLGAYKEQLKLHNQLIYSCFMRNGTSCIFNCDRSYKTLAELLRQKDKLEKENNKTVITSYKCYDPYFDTDIEIHNVRSYKT